MHRLIGCSAPESVHWRHLGTASLGDITLLGIALPSIPLSCGRLQAGSSDPFCVQGSGLTPSMFTKDTELQCEIPSCSPESLGSLFRGSKTSDKSAGIGMVVLGWDKGASFLKVCHLRTWGRLFSLLLGVGVIAVSRQLGGGVRCGRHEDGNTE